jgi:type IV secretory pathway TrbL component
MLIAAVIAIPFTWLFFENSFLRQYHYKIEIGIGEVAISLALLVGIGLTTILSQTIRAARANPVDTLKNE